MSSIYHWGSVIETAKNYGLSALLAFGILFITSLHVNCTVLYYVGGILFLTSVLAPFLVKWIPKKRIHPEGKAVLISGCDTGFGYLLAQRLDDIGFHVFAGCLFPDGDGAVELRKSGSDRLHVFGLDVTSDISVQEAAAFVQKNLKDIVLWAIVNNAGVAGAGELHWTSVDTVQRIIEVNTLGVVRVTKAFLPELIKSKGRILTVASLAGRQACPCLVPYSMSKAAIISFCSGLRLEMYKWGIQVITIEPSFYRTPIVSEEGSTKTITQEWNRAPQDIKDIYSSLYIQKFIRKTVSTCVDFSKDPSEVVSVLEDAISALFPEYSYTSGGFVFRFTVWLSQRLPTPIFDMLMFYILGLDLR